MPREEELLMLCPHCQEEIKDSHRVGITQINSIVHLYCGAWPRPGERLIKEGRFKTCARNTYDSNPLLLSLFVDQYFYTNFHFSSNIESVC